jgi:Tol biopolymer transport system component
MQEGIGPYQVVGALGAGGMGEVYKALDTRVGRHVALKLLPESMAQDGERRRRFEQEARLAASLNHPNIMAIYDVGLDQHPPYIVAELVPGESLRSLIGKGPVAPRRAVDIAAQIAAGLAAAHAAGIVHRDLKPENIMVTPEGVVKILDFGIARTAPKAAAAGNATMTIAHTMDGSVVGTAAYMSPEQARAQDVDHRSDQFSLGLVVYELLSGKQAFERPSAVQTMSAIVEDDPPPLDRPIPAQLRWILDRCLAKEREGRYESTRDLARDLAQLRDHYGEAASSGTGTQAVAAAPRRRMGVAIASAAGVLAGAALAWCAAVLLRDPGAVNLAKYKITPFATALSMQTYPAWSPDGKSIAFLGYTDNDSVQLFVQGLDAATAVQITGQDVDVNTGAPPFWTADSRTIYFRCTIAGTGGGLCRIPAGGGGPTLVQKNVQSASISPDGRTLAIWPGFPEGGNLALWIASPPEGKRRRYDPMPFQSTQYYNNPAIAFTPDGKHILLSVALDTRGETSWLLPWPEGKGRPVLLQAALPGTPQPSWLPDSRHFVFAGRSPGAPSRLFMTDTKSGRYWPVLAQDRTVSYPTASPDGARVAYTSGLSHADIIAVPLGDGPVRTLLGSSRNEERVDASPVAQQLAYVTDRRGVPEVWIKSLAEGWERPLLTPNDVQEDGRPATGFMNPAFSPDGRRVAVGVITRSGIRLYTMFASGGAPVRATNVAGAFEMCATWSPDGNWLAYSGVENSQPMLLKVRPGSGEAPVPVGELYGQAVPVWSPAGDWIAGHETNGGALTLVSPDGKEKRKLPGDYGPVAWSRDGKTLYQVHAKPPMLMVIDIASGKERKLRDLEGLAPFANGNPGLSAALTSDQKSIVYTVNRPRQEIWILDGVQWGR